MYPRTTRNLPRRDYAALNNGIDIAGPSCHVQSLPPSGQQESLNITEHSQSDGSSPSDSVSQVLTESTFQISSSPSPPLGSASEVSTASSSSSILSKSKVRKEKSRTSWTAEHFWFTALDRKWVTNGRSRNDRLVVCRRCSWSTSDSALHGSTSNLAFHLRTRHQIGPGSSIPSLLRAPTLDQYLQPQKARLTVEQALLQWIVQTRQPFTTVEHPAFRAIFDAAGADLPIRGADTVHTRIEQAFQGSRNEVKQHLAQSCESIALSLDVWTSDHQLAILAVIGNWITPDFEKQEVLLDFIELRGTHSGENMAEVLWNTVQEQVSSNEFGVVVN